MIKHIRIPILRRVAVSAARTKLKVDVLKISQYYDNELHIIFIGTYTTP